jgi:hypothetical protein
LRCESNQFKTTCVLGVPYFVKLHQICPHKRSAPLSHSPIQGVKPRHIASFFDTLPLTNQRGLRSVGSLKTCHYLVTSSGNRWQQVSTGVNRCLLVAVRSHFGLRLGGRNNPDRASNRILGRRIISFILLPRLGRSSFCRD